MDSFKIPSSVPQDLQLIHEIIGEISIPPVQKSASPQPTSVVFDEDINSSDSDIDSEREVEANILGGPDEEEDESPPIPTPSDSASTEEDSSDSDSDSDSDIPAARTNVKPDLPDFDEDEDSGPTVSSDNPLRTKNEVPEADIVVPDIEEVDSSEVLEKVGEVFNIVDRVVIVMGSASHIANRASERALDSDTLLVFGDRKVLGYIYETFGPTHQPLYQVKFNQKFPLDPEKVHVGREVFHVAARSNFVFLNQIKHFKGSDASNAYDEEPGDDEMEFSDDEEEQAHKRALQQKRAGRSGSLSRHTTPTPSQLRDQDMAEDLYSASPYDQSYNDMDFGAGPSRPSPIPYDDPYSDSYGVPEEKEKLPSTSKRGQNDAVEFMSDGHMGDNVRRRGRGQGPVRDPAGPSRHNDRGRGRGRGHQRDRGGRGRGRGRGRDNRVSGDGMQRQGSFSEDKSAEIPRPLSPTSLAIARATGQYTDGTIYAMAASSQGMAGAQNGWEYPPTPQQQPSFDFGYQQPFVQPHINPRFASAFGLNFGTFPQQGMGGENYGYSAYGSDYGVPTNGSGGDWTQPNDSRHDQDQT